ncbi:hypothetical protein P9126_20800 [Bacillus glycinifermentans]|nr:hypothetical protein [Bacillus glycinifermentans]MEC3609394.1 hypothetical protein [Bacillus glycinifermentans]
MYSLQTIGGERDDTRHFNQVPAGKGINKIRLIYRQREFDYP